MPLAVHRLQATVEGGQLPIGCSERLPHLPDAVAGFGQGDAAAAGHELFGVAGYGRKFQVMSGYQRRKTLKGHDARGKAMLLQACAQHNVRQHVPPRTEG